MRAWIRETLPEAEEVWAYGMPGIAKDELIASYKSQKNYISLYMDVDAVAKHKEELDAAGLNCGKSCIRFKRLDQLPEATIKAMLRETMAKQAGIASNLIQDRHCRLENNYDNFRPHRTFHLPLLRRGLPAGSAASRTTTSIAWMRRSMPRLTMACSALRAASAPTMSSIPGRVKTPLIRANREEGRSAPPVWREATWDEALDLWPMSWCASSSEHGGDAIGSYASAKATNEDTYVFQKFIRALLGTNNVDHCARLCHAGSVTGLQLAIGSSAMSNSIAEMENLDVFIVTGSNTTETHPVIANFLKRAVRKNGAKLIVIDPRQIDMIDFSTLWLQQNPGTDVAVFQAMAHVDRQRRAVRSKNSSPQRTEGFPGLHGIAGTIHAGVG